MSKKIISTALALAMAATSTVGLTGTADARSRHHGYYSNYNDGYYYRRHRHHNHNGDAIAAGVLGFALGAIVVGSTQRRYVRRDYYDGGRYYDSGYDRYHSRYDHVRRCESRYRSYDRRTDTFIGRDGREYYCNL